MKLIEISNTPEDIALHEEDIDLWEMANLDSKFTGIDNIIVWVNGGGDKLRHGPRIKVCRGLRWNKGETATIPLFGTPRAIGDIHLTQEEFAQIIKWVEVNKKALIAYSNDELSTNQLFSILQNI